MTLLFAATYPDRTAAAVLYGCRVSYVAANDYPWGFTPEERAESIRKEATTAGTDEWLDDWLDAFAPSLASDEAMRRWWRRLVLTSASPGAVVALRRMNMEIDARPTLAAIRVPTLALCRVGDGDYPDQARYIADRIPGAEFLELPGHDHGYFVDPEQIAREVKRFLCGIWEGGEWDVVEADRVLATVLFTDIVGSTEKAAKLGDKAWRELLERHHAVIRRQLVRYRGKEIDTAGDGFFASFDGPARAIRCACAIAEAVQELGPRGARGPAHRRVRVGGRQSRRESPSTSVPVSREGAGPARCSSRARSRIWLQAPACSFEDRGTAELKGVPGEWRLYEVERVAATT